jgi:superfamily II DNA/RNA helicase
VERALDPALLTQALGNLNNLPSVEELARLLAQAEVAQILTERQEMPPELLKTGWALLGVASSRIALERYGFVRQRSALQVSGHIFDLALQRLEFDPETTDQLELCFAAQLAYMRSEFAPNAMALYRREFPAGLGALDLVLDFRKLALSAGIALLAMDAAYIRNHVRPLVQDGPSIARSWGLQRVEQTIFGAAFGVVNGCFTLMQYLTEGFEQSLLDARAILLEAVNSESASGDRISRWVASSLLDIVDGLETSSVWSALPPQVPQGVRRAFAQTNPRMLTLWPPQLDLVRHNEQNQNPLDPETKRQLISMPTSAGKTQMAHLLVMTHLVTSTTSVCFVAPTRSLCHEIRKSLDQRLRFLRQNRVMADLPAMRLPEGMVPERPTIEVMTPERLAFLIRNDLQGLLERFGLFVFDEVHNVAGSGRGWTLESDLALLHHATLETAHRIVVISAVIGNRIHFVQWLTAAGQEPLNFHHDWRGPRRMTGVWSTRARWDEAVQRPVRKNSAAKSDVPLLGILRIRTTEGQDYFTASTSEAVGTLVLRQVDQKSEVDKSSSTPNYRTLLPLIHHLRLLGPVLVIVARKSDAISMAQALVENLESESDPNLLPLVDLATSLLGEDHPIQGILRHGVAYHHGSLPGELRTEIEEAMAGGQLSCLVATTTMTEGVNLPVRSVVIASQGAHGADGYTQYITGTRLVNAIGRAGRAAKETEGIVVVAQFNNEPPNFAQFAPTAEDLYVISGLATDKALEELALFEERQRQHVDALFDPPQGAVGDFVSFVLLIAQGYEDQTLEEVSDSLEDVLSSTLAWVQLTGDGKRRWSSLGQSVIAQYRQLDSLRRRRWARVGVSINTARVLDDIAQRAADIFTEEGVPDDPFTTMAYFFAGENLDLLLELPEVRIDKVFNQRGGRNRIEIVLPLLDILRDWLAGRELKYMADTYFSQIKDVNYRFEQLGDFIYETFEMVLPRLIGILVDWTNDALETLEASPLADALETLDSVTLVAVPRLPLELAAFARCGVNDPLALQLILRGLPSRRLSLAVTRQWHEAAEVERDENTAEIDALRDWLATMRLPEWQRRFAASRAELRSLLDFVRPEDESVGAILLSGRNAKILLTSAVPVEFDNQVARLAPNGDFAFAPIGAWIDDQYIEDIPTKYQSDVQSVLSSGLIIEVRLLCRDGTAEVSLNPIEPE